MSTGLRLGLRMCLMLAVLCEGLKGAWQPYGRGMGRWSSSSAGR